MNYEARIRQSTSPTLDEIISIARDCLAMHEASRPWDGLNHGVGLLESETDMNKYLAAYGKMHQAKMNLALESLSVLSDLDKFNIIDWGCGQGLGTVCMFDHLNQIDSKAQPSNIILIEPSSATLRRAVLHAEKSAGDVTIKTVNKYIDDVVPEDVQIDNRYPTFHIFSNILDIPSIDLRRLARHVSFNNKAENYVISVGPLNYGNKRINAFYNYFGSPFLLANKEEARFDYGALSHRCTVNLLSYRIDADNQFIYTDNYPSVQFFAGYQLDSVSNALSGNEELKSRVTQLLSSLSMFDVDVSYDLNAAVYDDAHPLLATLNNMIVRGLPTKASPYVENAFRDSFGITSEQTNSGQLSFPAYANRLNREDVFTAMHVVDSRLDIAKEYNFDALESDLERNFIKKQPAYISQILQPQRNLASITNDRMNYSQRVDFAMEYPYRSDAEAKGCVLELDSFRYHSTDVQRAIDKTRQETLARNGWNCIRVEEDEINNPISLPASYMEGVKRAYDKSFDENWVRTLQFALTPLGIGRMQKVIVEAMLTGKLDMRQNEWRILVYERDVPCTALAFRDLEIMFNNLAAMTKEFDSLKFPKVSLDIVSTPEFCDSPLHLNHNVAVDSIKTSGSYDMIVDISMLRRAGIDAEKSPEIPASCYFKVRTSHYKRSERRIYTTDRITYKPLLSEDGQESPDECDRLRFFLQQLFRKSDFRPGQIPILNRALQNKNVIGLLPTGGGKSLTYQLAAMLQPGVTIIIDPLRSLMKDQYDGLVRTGIDSCAYINSTLTSEERREKESRLERSELHFIFMSPERLCIYGFRKRLQTMEELKVYFSYGVIDEVHCVSEWGHDFRFSYLHLGRNMYNYVKPKPTSEDDNNRLTLFGLTATASFDVLADVERELSGDRAFELDPDTIVRYENTNRLELQYKVEKVDAQFDQDQFFDRNGQMPGIPKPINPRRVKTNKDIFVRNYIKKIPALVEELQTDAAIHNIKKSFQEREDTSANQNEAINIDVDLAIQFPSDFHSERDSYDSGGIIFCPHRKSTEISVEKVADQLDTIAEVGRFVGSSGMNDTLSDEVSLGNLEKFRDNKLPLMVATKAFGMGIDKPNVRFTVNLNYPSSLESFVQEAGRAGRDRRMALSTIIISDYNLLRINKSCPDTAIPSRLRSIKNKWFNEKDLMAVIRSHQLSIEDKYLDRCSPSNDLAQLYCSKGQGTHKKFMFNECDSCENNAVCRLKLAPQAAKGWMQEEELIDILTSNNLYDLRNDIEYLNPDYRNVMFFFNQNFKGELEEKKTMNR